VRPGDAAAIWMDPSELAELEASPNPRKNARAVLPVAKSIERFGFLAPIVARAEDRAIAAGHTRWKGALEQGAALVRVVLVEGMSDEDLRAYRLADNGLGALASWDTEALRKEVAELAEVEVDLEGLGWTREAMAKLLGQGGRWGSLTGTAKAPELKADPDSKPGQLYELGPHRLLVGDSTDLDQVRELLGDEVGKARLVFTDPPFAIFGSSTGTSSTITDDRIVRPMFRQVLQAAELSLELAGAALVCCDWRSWPSWWEVARSTNLDPRNLLVWRKSGAGLGSSFGNSYELIGYWTKAPTAHTMTDKARPGIRPVYASNDLGEYSRVAGDEREHNAQKPAELVSRCVELLTEPGELVVDLFGGSGTTLAVCAQLEDRPCRMMEIDPAWADVIRRRWTRLAEDLDVDPGAGALGPADG